MAERYTSKDSIEPGDLVAVDPTDSRGVLRAFGAYQSDLLGVVSTQPGFIAGAFTENSFPIALAGRVPVNVTLDNGPIRKGDRLTSSTLSGYAMKALQRGRVVGFALDDSDASTFRVCKKDPSKRCGQVMMFVNLRDWPGLE